MSASILPPPIHLCTLDLRSPQSPRRASFTPVASPYLSGSVHSQPTSSEQEKIKPQSDRVTCSQVPVVQPSLVPGPSAVAYPPLRPRSITLSHWLCIRMVAIISQDYAPRSITLSHLLGIRMVIIISQGYNGAFTDIGFLMRRISSSISHTPRLYGPVLTY